MPTEAHTKYPPVYTMFLARVAREFCAGNLLSVDMDGSFQSMLPCRWVNPAAHLELARRERLHVPSNTHTPSCVLSMYTHAPSFVAYTVPHQHLWCFSKHPQRLRIPSWLLPCCGCWVRGSWGGYRIPLFARATATHREHLPRVLLKRSTNVARLA